MLRRLSLVAAVGLLSVVGPASAAAGPHHTNSCRSHRAQARVVTSSVLVYGRVIGTDPLGARLTTYYACERTADGSVAIGSAAPSDGFDPPNETAAEFKVAGRFVAAQFSRGAAQAALCARAQGTNCPTVKNWIEVVDAQTHRHLRVFIATPDAFALSSAGALAWIDTAVPRPAGLILKALVLHQAGARGLAGSPQTIATATVDPHSLHLDGLTVHWTAAGQPQQLTLH